MNFQSSDKLFLGYTSVEPQMRSVRLKRQRWQTAAAVQQLTPVQRCDVQHHHHPCLPPESRRADPLPPCCPPPPRTPWRRSLPSPSAPWLRKSRWTAHSGEGTKQTRVGASDKRKRDRRFARSSPGTSRYSWAAAQKGERWRRSRKGW